MKKVIYFALVLCLIVSSILFAGCNENKENAQTTNIRIVALGDSISAGYAPQNTDLYQYYNLYSIGRTKINEKCFTNVIANNIEQENVNVRTISYAESGDTTSDLITKFNDKRNYPDLLTDINRANILTVCIGANNVLKVAIDNLPNYIAGNVTQEEIETQLISGYERFKNDYTNNIIPVLTRSKAKIYVMTIYDPYKYASLSDITITGNYNIDITEFDTAFADIKALAIKYLDKINEYIRTQKFTNVYVVDVNKSFEKLTKAQYSTYLNVDTSKITININSAMDLVGLQSNLVSNIYFDPHPTMQGQVYIASLFEAEMAKN